MDNDAGSKPSAIKSFFGSYYLVFRYIYPTLLIIGALFSITGTEFLNKEIELTVLIIYYIFGIVSAITLFTFDITVAELFVMLLYPILMALSPVPYETGFLIVILIAIILKYKKRYKALLISCFVICIVIGMLIIPISGILQDFGKTTILSSEYSDDGKYKVDVISSDQGALGGNTVVNLYRVYGDILQRCKCRLYTGHYGESPTISWVDNETVIVSGEEYSVH